jgi:hypothetical protein
MVFGMIERSAGIANFPSIFLQSGKASLNFFATRVASTATTLQ